MFLHKPDALLKSPQCSILIRDCLGRAGPVQNLGYCCAYLCSHASCLRSRDLRVYSVLSRVLFGVGIARQRDFDGHCARWCSGRCIVLTLATGGRANVSICSAGGIHRRESAKVSPFIAVLVNKVMAEDYVNMHDELFDISSSEAIAYR